MGVDLNFQGENGIITLLKSFEDYIKLTFFVFLLNKKLISLLLPHPNQST